LKNLFPNCSLNDNRPWLSDEGFQLLSSLLEYDPENRISAKDALDSDYFKEFPKPSIPDLN
jgi:cell division cycle 2-like protein